MSTFNGIIHEFPGIRVDCFVGIPGHGNPLAGFLSHVHHDHLRGLESKGGPLIYCSAATREILLRLERYWCRTMFAKGIIETRQVTYKRLGSRLKPVPLETPTKLELWPGHTIQFTLLEANHCPGSVMFLFEDAANAILYTGDIRSEPWFVNTLARSPSIMSYTAGLKTLDCIYLDTSFVEDIPFQTKAEGIAELLRKVAQYPADTIFHFQAWTYGYEDVWIALAKALDTRIHVDEYKMRIYSSLVSNTTIHGVETIVPLCPEAAALAGSMCGNAPHPGCLTSDTNVRLHSCEKGNFCDVVKAGPVVSIQPIIAHLDGGIDQLEVGVGGGATDLAREVELATLEVGEIDALINRTPVSKEDAEEIIGQLRDFAEHANVRIDVDAVSLGDDLEAAAKAVLKAIRDKMIKSRERNGRANSVQNRGEGLLPRTIHFPYSRHSSYRELCHLVDLFKPKDVWPCTEDPYAWLEEGITIQHLFGEYCSGSDFAYDACLERLVQEREPKGGRSREQSKELVREQTTLSEPSQMDGHQQVNEPLQVDKPLQVEEPMQMDVPLEMYAPLEMDMPLQTDEPCVDEPPQMDKPWVDGPPQVDDLSQTNGIPISTREKQELPNDSSAQADIEPDASTGHSGMVVFDLTAPESHSQVSERSVSSQVSQLCGDYSHERADAYAVAIQNLQGGAWQELGLLSTSAHHTHREEVVPGAGEAPNSDRRRSATKRKSDTGCDDARQRRRA